MDQNVRLAALKASRLTRTASKGVLQKELTLKQRGVLATAPAKVLGMLEKAYKGTISKRSLVKIKCYECCGFEDTIVRTRECSCSTCPLWRFRPNQK